MNIREAAQITSSFTKTSKMPGYSYSLPAWACQTGAKLRKAKDSPCFGCYALKGNYARYPLIKKIQYKRLDSIKNPLWVRAMAIQISSKKISKAGFFRWHDAGDIQSVKHLLKIFKICKLTPKIKHWLPTQERQYILKIPKERIPKNLIIRLSGSKVDGPRPKIWPWTSTVVTSGAKCPAPTQGGKCLDCRKCWTKSIQNVSYGKH
jgi:hypothetical protein